MAVQSQGLEPPCEIEIGKFDLWLWLAFELEINEIKGQSPYEYVKECVYYQMEILYVDYLRGIIMEMARKGLDDEIE